MPVLYTPDSRTVFVGSGAPATQAPSLGWGFVLGASPLAVGSPPALYTPDAPTIFVGNGVPVTQSPSIAWGVVLGTAITAGDSEDQLFANFPVPVEAIRNKVSWVPFLNNTGQTLEIGDAVCQAVDADGNTTAAIASATSLYMPWGIVFVRDVPDGLMGYICTGGIINAKVLGASGLTAGLPLAPVVGQTYLTEVGFTPEGGQYYPYLLRENQEITQTVLRRILVRTIA